MYDAVADLPLSVESLELEYVERETPDFTRATTVIELRGGGETGRGEDVTYEREHHDALRESGLDVDAAGEYTLAEFSAFLEDADLWPDEPEREAFRDYRRWAFEAAALDLALRQADETLADRLDRGLDSVRFVVSESVPDGDTSRVETLLERYPDAELKLDATAAWTDETFAALADTDAVRVVDLKGRYEGTDVDQAPDAELYDRVFAEFPDAVIEDPALDADTRGVVEANADRVSWDAPIHGLADVDALPFEAGWLNVKPSRFGTVESLFETVSWALEHDVSLYGGGQYELSVGRGQIQELASLFYPAGPNDVSPGAYNEADVPTDPPESPISVPDDHAGFGF
ncbi:MAG: hypothetical protein ABEJ90_01580 [Halobacterium sp.]